MHSSKLLQLIRNLSQEEMRWLAKFVRSPYYNSNKEVIGLFDYIRKYHPECDSPKLTKEQVFKKLWPKKAFVSSQLQLLMFRLSELIEQFLVAQKLKEDQVQNQQLLINIYKEKGLYDGFLKKTESLSKEILAAFIRDETFYEMMWQLQYGVLSNPKSSPYRITSEELSGAMHQLDAYYFITKLYFSGELLNRQNIVDETYEILLLDEIRSLIKSHPVFQDNMVLQVYNDILNLLEDNHNEATYLRLEHNFLSNRALFQRTRQTIILRYLINCTIQLYKNANTSYLNNQFRLYKIGFAENLLEVDGKIPATLFLNSVITASTLKEVKWMEATIQAYENQLEPEKVGLAKAYLLFAKGHFEQSSQQLAQLNVKELGYQLQLRFLSIRNHFELYMQDPAYYEVLHAELNAFEKFLRRDGQLKPNSLKAYLNALSLIKKMARLINEFVDLPEKQIARLKEAYAKMRPLVARRWFEQKIDSLS